jgi:urease accessory protein UreF
LIKDQAVADEVFGGIACAGKMPAPQDWSSSVNVLGLVQLCQSTSPGTYAFGIERLTRGRATSAEELTDLVISVLRHDVAPADGVAAGIAFRAARRSAFEQLPEVCEALNTSHLPNPIRLESIHTGRRLWGMSRGWEWAAAVHDQLDAMAERTDLHHAVAFGTLVSETTASEARAIATYLFSTARGIVLTAIKAIPLDDATGQRVLAEVQGSIAEMAARCVDRGAGEIN